MGESISARRLADLVGAFDRTPAYAGLADALTLLIGDGRIPLDVRLPSERELTVALDVSRTTVTRAYAILRESGFATATQGSGTYTAVPGGRARAHDRVLSPRVDGEGIDLVCAAASAPAEMMTAYAAALADLPAYLSGPGYFPAGLPVLQEAVAASYEARGLPTDPAQIIVTPGALTAAAIVAHALTTRRDRVMVESPTYPNATQALREVGVRLVEAAVDVDRGWDLDAIGETLRQTTPTMAYLVLDFQNPTGHVMPDEDRARLARRLRKRGTLPVVDEAHVALALDGRSMPLPFATHAPEAVTIGSASKAFWGGLRVGWIRAPHGMVDALTRARLSLDLGVPVMEQLAAAHLLRQGPVSQSHLVRLRAQREALVDAVVRHLPEWTFRRAAGGLALWCELPTPSATAIAAAVEPAGVAITPGPVFAVSGGLDRFVRLPWTRPAAELETAVERIAAAWNGLGLHAAPGRARKLMTVA